MSGLGISLWIMLVVFFIFFGDFYPYFKSTIIFPVLLCCREVYMILIYELQN